MIRFFFGSHVTISNSPGQLIGGGGNPKTSSTASILPWAWAESTSVSGPAGLPTFVTWDSTSGRIKLLDSTLGYQSNLALAGQDDNVHVFPQATVQSGGQTINSIRVQYATINGIASDVLTINSGAILGTGDSTFNAPVRFQNGVEGMVHVANGTLTSTITFNGVIDGDNGLTKSGLGTMTLNALNTYSGVTTLNSGTIRIGQDVLINQDGAFGNSDTAIVLNAGDFGSCVLSATNGRRTIDRDISVTTGDSQPALLRRDAVGDSLVVNGDIQIENRNESVNHGFLWVYGGTVLSEATVLNGVIRGTGGLSQFPDSICVLNGNNTYSGGTNLYGGTFLVGHDNAFGTGALWCSNTDVVVSSNGGARTIANELRLASNITFGGSDALNFSGAVFLAGGTPRTVTVDTTPAAVSFDGVVFGGSLLKSGSGILRLSNTGNTFAGTTTVRNGSLVLGGDALHGSGVLGINPNTTVAITLGDGSTAAANNLSLLVNGAHTVARSIQVNGQNSIGTTTVGGTNSSGSAIYSGQINLNRGSTNFTAATGGTVHYTGAITQSVVAAANFVGGGIQNLTAANTYGGGTTVTGGTLGVNNTAGSATGTGNVVVNVGATLGGAGFIVPDVGNTVMIDGTVAPGNSAGTLTLGSIVTPTSATLSGIYEFELEFAGIAGAALNSGTSSPFLPHVAHDVLSVFGSLDLTGSTINIVALNGTGFNSARNYSWLVGTTNGLGPLTGLSTIGSVGGGDFTGLSASSFSVGNVGGNFYLNYVSSVPEPGTPGLLAMGLLLFTIRRRTM